MNGRLNFSINFAWDFKESLLIPITIAFLSVKLVVLSLKSQASVEQPGVLSLG